MTMEKWLRTSFDRCRNLPQLKRPVLALRRARTFAMERYLNIHTPYPNVERYDLGTLHNDAVPNEPVDYVLLRRFMRPLKLTRDDIVFDIGCGMGRTVCMFARRMIKRCVGIEFDGRLVASARENVSRLRGRRAEVEIRHGDAAEADYSGGTVYWMFNPFGNRTLQAVLERIHQSVLASPRSIQIVYINPVHDSEIVRCHWLEHAGKKQSLFFGCYGASYWRSVIARVPEAASSIELAPA